MYFYHPNTRAASLLIGLLLDPQRVAGIKDRPARKETSIIKGYPQSGIELGVEGVSGLLTCNRM